MFGLCTEPGRVLGQRDARGGRAVVRATHKDDFLSKQGLLRHHMLRRVLSACLLSHSHSRVNGWVGGGRGIFDAEHLCVFVGVSYI